MTWDVEPPLWRDALEASIVCTAIGLVLVFAVVLILTNC